MDQPARIALLGGSDQTIWTRCNCPIEEALSTSQRIGAAIGIVMARPTVVEGDAFDVLRLASQSCNRKLRDVADDVVRTGVTT